MGGAGSALVLGPVVQIPNQGAPHRGNGGPLAYNILE